MSVEADVAATAEQQYGVIERAQAKSLGMTDAQIEHRVKQGRMLRVFPGVYRYAGTPRTGRQRALAACLWLGEDARTSHLTAATLLRLDGCRTRDLHVTVPRSVRRRSKSGNVHIHRALVLPTADRTYVDGIPCTSATRTIVDCAALLDDEALEVAFESARRMGLTSPRSLAQRAGVLCGSGKPGSRAIRALLTHQRAGEPALQYRLEVKTARLLRSSRLPAPTRQFPLGRFRIDFAFAPQRVGVECEGFEFHGHRLQWKRDRRRTAWIEAQGWRLVFVTWDDVTQRSAETIDRINHALTR